jgi:hypothetical protein
MAWRPPCPSMVCKRPPSVPAPACEPLAPEPPEGPGSRWHLLAPARSTSPSSRVLTPLAPRPPAWGVARALAACLGLLAAGSLLAGAPLRAGETPYPAATLFQDIQRDTLSCGRDNTASSCDRARSLADPLLDHPRLSSSCKDALWAVRQRAVAAPSNSLARRDPIDSASRDIGAFCRQPSRPAAPAAAPTGPDPSPLKFGGFGR